MRMTMGLDFYGNADSRLRPTLVHQLLRGCADCGEPHPIATRSPNPTICPACGAPSAPPGAVRTERAVLTGGAARIGSIFLAIGDALARLARSIRP